MTNLLAALVDLSSGVLFVLIAFFAARVLLQNQQFIYGCFPLLIAAALVVGFWRGLKSKSAPAVIASLASTPVLALALYVFSGRNKPFIVFPVITFAFVWAGAALARRGRPSATAAAGIAIALVAGAFAGPYFVTLMVPNHDVKESAPPFTVHRIDGAAISSQSLQGKIVVLDFWATWCVPCQHELPAVQRVYDSMKPRQEVAFFAIDGIMTDSPADSGDTAEQATIYFRRHGLTLPLSWDEGAVLEKAFMLRGFPTLLVLDQKGRVRMRHVGYLGAENIERTLAEKIGELEREAHE